MGEFFDLKSKIGWYLHKKSQKWQYKNGNTKIAIQKWQYKNGNTKIAIQKVQYKNHKNTSSLLLFYSTIDL